MFELEEIVHQLAQRDEIVIRGELFKLKNVVTAADGNVMKSRIILESVSNENHIKLDVGISARMYKR